MNLIPEQFQEKLTRARSVRHFKPLEDLLASFLPGERLVLYCLTVILALGAFALVVGVSRAASVVAPLGGGSFTEGVVGPPRFINPVLALSQADEDLSQLIYSGLTQSLPDGSIVPSLADGFEISVDGTTYTFTIREGATFHDGTSVSAEDVLFTIQAAQNPEIKSPRRADWEGVSVSSPNSRTVVFKLPNAYAPFIENTTLGILPKHLWGSIKTEDFAFNPLNTHPVGSGPYRVVGSQTDSTGTVKSFSLVPFKEFVLNTPYINKINFLFYPNQEALLKAFNAGEVDSIASISPADLATLQTGNATVFHVPLPRVFGVFFNQNHLPLLADASVRAALNAAIDKQALVDSVLKGYGVVLDGPIPPGLAGTPAAPTSIAANASATSYADNARAILSRNGWTFDENAHVWTKKKETLSLSLATVDTPELSATANAIAGYWRAAGIEVSVHVYPLSEFNTTVIRPRAYDAILFGEVVGRTLDLFAFWHSSQRNDPGINLAMYANSSADSLLAQARATTNRTDREKLYRSFAAVIAKDQPAIFLYSPEFIYVVPNELKGISLSALTTPSERFLNVHNWYKETQYIWSAFSDSIPQ